VTYRAHTAGAYADVLALPSSTHLSKTPERHVLLYASIGGAEGATTGEDREVSRVDAVQAMLMADDNLRGVIRRFYRLDGALAGLPARTRALFLSLTHVLFPCVSLARTLCVSLQS